MDTNDFGQRFKNAAAKPPSAFGKNTQPNTTVYGRIVAVGEQPRLKFNGAPGEVDTDKKGNPILQAYITLDTPAGPRNLYPTWRMEQAIGTALEKAGSHFNIGDTLSITFVGADPNEPRAKLYTAVYTPATPASGPLGAA
ncbi:hypothetical protein ACQP1O_33230 [Nocardia sp. CA-151230]|uniref:hypothetical protein n=1 Tax=Nocardia sp. CA-151230 TaxID=3239982 RepID=UPI003D9209A3